MVLQIRLKPAALRDLEEIHDWTARNFGLKQAETYIRRIQAGLESSAQRPMAAASAEYLRKGLRRLVIESHVVFYRFDADSLTVLRILHARMDPGRHL